MLISVVVYVRWNRRLHKAEPVLPSERSKPRAVTHGGISRDQGQTQLLGVGRTSQLVCFKNCPEEIRNKQTLNCVIIARLLCLLI